MSPPPDTRTPGLSEPPRDRPSSRFHSSGIRFTPYPFYCHITLLELMSLGCNVDTSVSWKTLGVHTGGVAGFGMKGPCSFRARKIDETLVERWDPCSDIVRLQLKGRFPLENSARIWFLAVSAQKEGNVGDAEILTRP